MLPGIKELKYISRVRACFNTSIGNAVTNAEKCSVLYKADTTLTSFLLQLFSPPYNIEGERAPANPAVIFLQGTYFWYKTKLVSSDGYGILNKYLRNTLMR